MQMKKLLSTGLILGILASQTGLVGAVELPKISGFVNTTYNYNFSRPLSRTTNFRSYDKKTDTFLLNSIQLNVQGSEKGIGYYVEIMHGEDALSTTGRADKTEIQEAFLTYQCPKTGVQFKAGKFATYQGIEVIESKDNFNISRGYLFGLAEPFTHVGALAGYAFDGIGDVWVGVVNGWDVDADNNTGKTLVAKIGVTGNQYISGLISMTHGSENATNTNLTRTSVDTVWTLKPVEKLAVALQLNAGQEMGTNVNDLDNDNAPDGGLGQWYGVSVQPKLTLCEKLSIGSRYEWFSDLNGARTNNNVAGPGRILQTVAITPSLNITEDLMFRVEYRYDWSTIESFENSVGLTNDKRVSTVSTEFVYKF